MLVYMVYNTWNSTKHPHFNGWKWWFPHIFPCNYIGSSSNWKVANKEWKWWKESPLPWLHFQRNHHPTFRGGSWWSTRTPIYPWSIVPGIPKPSNERNSFINRWLKVWGMFPGYVGKFLEMANLFLNRCLDRMILNLYEWKLIGNGTPFPSPWKS